MKIALVCPASLPATQFGGILFLGVDIARELSSKGHDVTIYTTDLDFANNPKTFNKKLPREELIEKFKIKRSHVWFSIKLFYFNFGMYSQMKKDTFDIIHSIGVRSFQSFIATFISKQKKIPLILSDQGGLTTHPDLVNANIITRLIYKLQKPMISFVVHQAFKIIVANEYEEKIFEDLGAKAKTVIVKNGINLKDFQTVTVDFKKKYELNERFILFIGRFSKIKGIDILIKAMDLIKQKPEMQNTKLVIMGVDFGFEATMMQMISDLRIDNKIKVIKNPPRKDVISAYSFCEFLVLPSRWELSPLTPLEGFAFKKPTITTRVHGIPYTVKDKENGLLIELENHYQLADAIIELLRNNEKKNQYGNAGYELVKQVCNSQSMAKNILQVYEEVINEKN